MNGLSNPDDRRVYLVAVIPKNKNTGNVFFPCRCFSWSSKICGFKTFRRFLRHAVEESSAAYIPNFQLWSDAAARSELRVRWRQCSCRLIVGDRLFPLFQRRFAEAGKVWRKEWLKRGPAWRLHLLIISSCWNAFSTQTEISSASSRQPTPSESKAIRICNPLPLVLEWWGHKPGSQIEGHDAHWSDIKPTELKAGWQYQRNFLYEERCGYLR